MSTIMTIADLEGLRTIAATMPDTPETVISLHMLRRGLCRAHIAGTPDQYKALVIDSDEVPGEPGCYGDDADAIWSILRVLPGWFAANMREPVAEAVGAHIQRDWDEAVFYLGDPHFTLKRPAPSVDNPAVRRLTIADLELLEAAPEEVRGAGFGSTRALLEDGIIAAAVVNDAVVAIAHTSAITDKHADIGVSTLEPFRGSGYASAAAALVARAIQATGRTPVWSCGEANHASLRVADKLRLRAGPAPCLRHCRVTAATPDVGAGSRNRIPRFVVYQPSASHSGRRRRSCTRSRSWSACSSSPAALDRRDEATISQNESRRYPRSLRGRRPIWIRMTNTRGLASIAPIESRTAARATTWVMYEDTDPAGQGIEPHRARPCHRGLRTRG